MATCADETVFYEKLDALKTSSKGKDSKTTFISDDFYHQAKLWLAQEEGSFESISKRDIATIKRKQWTLSREKFKTKMEDLLFQNETSSKH